MIKKSVVTFARHSLCKDDYCFATQDYPTRAKVPMNINRISKAANTIFIVNFPFASYSSILFVERESDSTFL